MMGFTSADVSVRSLVEQTVVAIRRAIIDGRLQPGERIVEAQIAAAFKIAQPTVREALIELEHRGFLVRVPHRGTFVINLTNEDAAEIYCARECLEVLTIKLARRRVTEAGLARVQENLVAMQKAAEAGDIVVFSDADLAFHRSVWEMSGNKCLVNLLEILTGPLALRGTSLFMRQQKEPNRADVVTWHQQITNCLTEGTDQDVERVMHQVYANFLSDYQRYSASVHGTQGLASGAEGEVKADSLPAKGRGSRKVGTPRRRAPV